MRTKNQLAQVVCALQEHCPNRAGLRRTVARVGGYIVGQIESAGCVVNGYTSSTTTIIAASAATIRGDPAQAAQVPDIQLYAAAAPSVLAATTIRQNGTINLCAAGVNTNQAAAAGAATVSPTARAQFIWIMII